MAPIIANIFSIVGRELEEREETKKLREEVESLRNENRALRGNVVDSYV